MSAFDEAAQAGVAALEKGEIETAIEQLTRATELQPDRPDITHALGTAYLQRGEVGTGLPLLEKAVALSEPFDAPEHQALKRQFQEVLAHGYRAADRVEDAKALLERIVARWPEALDPRRALGTLLLESGQLEAGEQLWRDLYDDTRFDTETRTLARALFGAIEAFRESDLDGDAFLRGHGDSYRAYFDEVAKLQEAEGWYAEAARMKHGPDGEPQPLLAEGARPYAMERVDLVNPRDGSAAGVYSETEPMVVALNGLEPLAQVPIVFPWAAAGRPYAVAVSSRCPWHWLSVQVVFTEPDHENGHVEPPRVTALDEVIGDWYLAGYNGDFGAADKGRFHYVTDLDPVGDRGVAFVVDLGRAAFDAIPALLGRLDVLHGRRPIERVVFGQAKLVV